ncbi:MAG: phosphate acyltransferase PlsX [Bryobacteraceae bacterium]|nr:phosphate acyltransferase PlsX [Bryobacteraceae bacterium]
MVTVAVDAMGGDNAPGIEIEGVIAAVRSLDVKVLLVGREELLRKELKQRAGGARQAVEIVPASEVVTMEDKPSKALRMRDSSIRVAAQLVRDGSAHGVVSAGNTGAAMATAKLVQGMVPGVERPALASLLPTVKGRPTILMDVGANVDCTPRMLAQFAVMGEVYARVILRRENPSVGILSIGEEDHKGNELTRNASVMLKSLPLNFIGNVEGRDVYTGAVDVVVCDGFVGNVALKVSEGLADFVRQALRETLSATLTRKLGYWISRSAYADFRKRFDYSETGGAPLLGVKGVCIICHGSSNANAIKNAIRIAAEFARGQVNTQIEDELSRWTATQLSANVT